MTITGSYANGGSFDSSIEHAHGIDLRGTAAEIANVAIDDVGGDCVYFGLGSDNATRSSGSFHDSSCSATSRNAVSVTAGNNVLVQRISTNLIGYDVFDVEPNNAAGNWGAQAVTFDSNTIGSYALSAYSVVENAPISSQSFTNNTVSGQGLKVTIGYINSVVSRPQGVTITGNSANAPQAPAAMNVSSVDGLTVTGNTVPMTAGTMASVDSSCNVNISNNSYPGGTSQSYVSPYSCGSPGPTSSSTPPTVTITGPSAGATVSGTRATIAAQASSTAVKMALYVDGTLQMTTTTTSISYGWNLKRVSRGAHTITVDAWDSGTNMGSQSITVYK
jgi:hypothetical protein